MCIRDRAFVSPEANIPVLVVVQVLEKIGQAVAGRLERLGRQHFGAAAHIGEIEALGRRRRRRGGFRGSGRAQTRHWTGADDARQQNNCLLYTSRCV